MDSIMRNNQKGFTLLELAIVVAIVGILSSVFMPKMTNLVTKTLQGATKGKLGGLRSAVNLSYIDNEGVWPEYDNGEIVGLMPKYISSIPYINVGIPHEVGGGCAGFGGIAVHEKSNIITDSESDDGYWFYDDNVGLVSINCTHTDVKGEVISLW